MKKIDDAFLALGGILKIAGFFALILFFVPIALVHKRLHPQDPFKISCRFHSLVLRILGIRLRLYGEPSTVSPVLFVANHVSYLDVIALGSLLPASFIAKSEVAGWPLFGFLAKVQNTIFIERRSTRAADQRTQLQDLLAQKQNLILFPEGTSSDGLRVLPFKSSLFSAVEDSASSARITVQPVSITCTQLDGFPMLREDRALYAWYGDMTLMPHLWDVFKRGHFTLDIIFHEPLTTEDMPNRKVLAAACQERVASGIEQSLSGKAPTQEPLVPQTTK